MGCACRPFLLPQNRSAAATFSSSCGGRSCYLYPSLPPLRHLQPFPPSGFLRNASISYLSPPVPLKTPLILSHLPCFSGAAAGSGNGNNHGSGGGRGGADGGWDPWDASHGDDCQNRHPFLVFLASAALGCLLLGSGFVNFGPRATALARLIPPREEEEGRKEGEEVVWEVKGSKWTKLVDDPTKDAFVVAESSPAFTFSGGIIPENLWLQCRNLLAHLLLPEGFPHSVTSDYLDYSLWRGVQGVASQISGVLATQSLLFAVGLGKGAIPTAAALNWVLKDGIGYASKILLSKYGRHFDVNPKGWRLFADLLENAAFGLEMLTPAFPHLFVVIGAAAGAGRSAAALIQAATRSCFYAGFAAQRNFAEVIAKGEAQGMVSKSIGIMLAIPLANFVGSSTPLALISFGVVTWIHMFCNLKSYQSIQLRTLNPYRASLVFSEYLLSGQVPSVKEVNDVEPLFPALPFLNMTPISKVESAALSGEAKNAAAKIEQRLQLGCKLSDIATSKKEVLVLFDLYRNEGYILIEHGEKFCVILKESSSPHDMLKSLFHVSYLYWLESHAGIKLKGTLDDCRPGGRLQTSLDYVQREFNHVKNDGELAGWVPDGLIARPLPNRIRPGYIASGAAR